MIPADNKMFGKAWWAQPLAARFASIDAHAVGLIVQVEMVSCVCYTDEAPCITWRGTADQFAATQTFAGSVFAQPQRRRYVHPDQLRGHVYPDGEEQFVFVIEWCYYYGRKFQKNLVKHALKDDAYLNFRDAVMAGYPMLADSAGAA